jgi:hypothetical protein
MRRKKHPNATANNIIKTLVGSVIVVTRYLPVIRTVDAAQL